jgi:hypothetical protein
VLLDPGTFLRVGEHASFRLLSDSLVSWQLELIQGSFVLEVGGEVRRSSPAVVAKDWKLTPLKRGVYRMDLNPPAIRVFEGEARVEAGTQDWRLGKGRMLTFDGEWAAAKFDRNADDELDRWSGRRASYLAQASFQAAAFGDRLAFGSSAAGLAGYWVFNPYLGMLTYIPIRGAYDSFYGSSFLSYQRAMEVLHPPQARPPRFDMGGGAAAPNYPTNAPTAGGTSGTIAAGSPVSTTPAGANSAPITREGGNASSRTR